MSPFGKGVNLAVIRIGQILHEKSRFGEPLVSAN